MQIRFMPIYFTVKTGSAVSNSWNEGRGRENDTNSR